MTEPSGFFVVKRGHWWVVAPIIETMSYFEMEKAIGEAIELYAYPVRHDAINKMFEIIDSFEGRK
jgi:hypothetical protein